MLLWKQNEKKEFLKKKTQWYGQLTTYYYYFNCCDIDSFNEISEELFNVKQKRWNIKN